MLQNEFQKLCRAPNTTSTEFLFGDNFSDEVKSIGELIKLTRTVERKRAPSPQTSKKTAKARLSERQTREGGGSGAQEFTGIQAPEPNTPVNQQANSSGQSTSLDLVSLKPNNTPNNFIGGQAGFYFSTWKSITPDSWILSQIEGVFPEFDSLAHQEKHPQPIKLSDTEKLALALKMKSLKNQQVISETKNYQENEILSNVFLRRKPNGT